jgi:hypothetical protein
MPSAVQQLLLLLLLHLFIVADAAASAPCPCSRCAFVVSEPVERYAWLCLQIACC